MVSFFGIRLGGDKKKSRKSQDKQPQKWSRTDQNTWGESHSFGQHLAPPQFPPASARPGSSQSTANAPSTWRAVFASPDMTSSMTDLSPPSMAGLRHHASDSNLRTNFVAASTPSLTMPAPLGTGGARPGTPSRPAATRNAEWVNPLDVHFCKGTSGARPGTPAGIPVAAASSGAPQSAFGPPDRRARVPSTEAAISRAVDERQPKLVSESSFGPTGYPSPPRSDAKSERAASPASPPHSTASSVSGAMPAKDVDASAASLVPPSHRTSDDGSNAPVIRDVPARRDTLTFHQPRRQSYTMEFDSETQKAARKTQHVEGFRGNFFEFDFGDSVRQPSVDAAKGGAGTAPGADGGFRSSPQAAYASEPDETTPADGWPGRAVSYPQSSEDGIPASGAVPARHEGRVSPSVRPSTGAVPLGGHVGQASPSAAAVGAHRDHRLGASPPRGFNSRFDPNNQTRAPPPRPLFALQSLAPQGQLSPSPRSPYGPPPDENNYVRGETPLQPLCHPPTSPFSRSPMVGDFPKSKGLPRGRRPEKPREPIDDDDEDEDDAVYVLPAWADFDTAEPRRSAMPAPLSTPRSDPSRSPLPSHLPSPTPPSLSKSVSGSSVKLAGRDASVGSAPGSSPRLGGLAPSPEKRAGGGGGVSPKRVEAVKAPPRPAGMGLSPPLSSKGSFASLSRSPTTPQFEGGFI